MTIMIWRLKLIGPLKVWSETQNPIVMSVGVASASISGSGIQAVNWQQR